jgi:hypothetical protein
MRFGASLGTATADARPRLPLEKVISRVTGWERWPLRPTALGTSRALVLTVLLGGGACGSGPAGPTPGPSPTAGPDTTLVTPTSSSGPTRIEFVSSHPAPGSTTVGCAAGVASCLGRLSMTLRLRSAVGGEVLRLSVFLHSSRLIACLYTITGPFDLQPGQPREVEVVFDRADACSTPVDLVTMDAAAEGTSAIASRQEWGLLYTLAP